MPGLSQPFSAFPHFGAPRSGWPRGRDRIAAPAPTCSCGLTGPEERTSQCAERSETMDSFFLYLHDT